ncbi:MAG: 30S ribosomal protein S9 [Bacteroidetes bacterium]|nr:30S ribosomal protein S9 [Bacteroidota bacterium]
MEVTNTSGRRKTAVARVYLTPGEGKIEINGKELAGFFPSPLLQYEVTLPFNKTETLGKYDVKVNVDGGGITGQAQAIRLAIAKALCEINPEHRLALKPDSLLTRDSRMVERKKPGQKKARRRFQFSKR